MIGTVALTAALAATPTYSYGEVLWHKDSNAECVVVMSEILGGDVDAVDVAPPCRLDWYMNAFDDEEFPEGYVHTFVQDCWDKGGVVTDIRGYTYKCEGIDY